MPSKRIEIPFTGEFRKAGTIFLNSADTINYFPETQDDGRIVLRGSPGLKEWIDLGIDSGIRGMVVSGGFLYAVCSNKVFKIAEAATKTQLTGVSIASADLVSIDENSLQVMIVDPITNKGYIVTNSTGVVSEIVDVDFPEAESVTFQDGFFIINRPSSAQFYTSDLNDGTSWPGDFSTAAWKTDDLVRCFSFQRDLYNMGEYSIEPWYNNGNSTGSFVFSRLEGAEMEIGLAAWNSVSKGDNAMFFLGRDRDGAGRVFQIAGRAASIISTDEVVDQIQSFSTISDAIGFVYHQGNHVFYELTFPTAGYTFVWDSKESKWHRKQSRITVNTQPKDSRHRINNHVYFAGKNLVGDFENGKIYEMSRDYFDEDGTDYVAERVSQPLNNNQDLITVHELQLLYVPGQGIVTGNPEDMDPETMVSWSNDGGYSFSNEIQAPIGKIGEYTNRATIFGCGQGRNWQWRTRISAAANRDLMGAYAIVEVDNA